MITKTTNLYEYEELTPAAKRAAHDDYWIMQYLGERTAEDIGETLDLVEDFNQHNGAYLEAFEAHGPGSWVVRAKSVDFFEIVELYDLPATHGKFHEDWLAYAYNQAIGKNMNRLNELFDAILENENEREDLPFGEPDYGIYDLLDMQAEFCDLIEQALEAAADEANDMIEAAGTQCETEYEFSELVSGFLFTESGEYAECF